jgi:NOL1/NOP2/fmu family ribosome biogenesis protein
VRPTSVTPSQETRERSSVWLHYAAGRPLVGAVRNRIGIGLNVHAAFRLSTCVQTILNPPAKSNVVDLAAHRSQTDSMHPQRSDHAAAEL